MNTETPHPHRRPFRWEWAAAAGLALALIGLWLWTRVGGGGRVLLASAGCALGGAAGVWLGRRSAAVARYGELLIAGGVAGIFGSIMAGHAQDPASVFGAGWIAWPLLAVCTLGLAVLARIYNSAWLAAAGIGLALLGVALIHFTLFSLAANLLLLLLTAFLVRTSQWTVCAWVMLVLLYLGFFLGWPFSDGRLDQDRFLETTEFWWALVFFTAAWAIFWRIATLAPADSFTPSRRLLFATLNNALFYLLGVLILPPRHPEYYWQFTFAAGLLFLVGWALTDRFPALRRAYFVHGLLLVGLGIASSFIGPQAAAMWAVASAFFVLSVETRAAWLLRYCAGLAAVLAVALAWDPVYWSKEPSLGLGIVTGLPLVFSSIWISRHRELWRNWAVLFFGALGLGTWLLTTLAQTPALHHPPILAVEAVLVTASFLVLGIREFPWLATSVLLLAQFLWFQQVGNFNLRPWWNPAIVIVCTLGLSWWWQTRGRSLVSALVLKWLQGLAAAAAVAILLLSIETVFGRTATALVVLSLLAVGSIAYASLLGDWLLFGFAQLFIVTAIGEFIGQLSSAPLPAWIAPLLPIAALLVIAPMLESPFTHTIWETPARWVAVLYRALAAALFVAWTLHYVAPPNRFLALALVALALLLVQLRKPARGVLLGSVVCAAGALLAFWLGWTGSQGFRLRDFAAFLLLLGFGQFLRRGRLLADELQTIGLVLGLAAVTQWVENWASYYHPAISLAVVWAIVAAVIVCVGWWLAEWRYRVFGWTLLLLALSRVVWVDLIESQRAPGTDPAFRLGLLVVGLAALIAALGSARRAPAEHPRA